MRTVWTTETRPVWTAERIKALRAKYGESQEEFRRRIGVSTGALQYWEQGKGEPSEPVQIILDRLEKDLAATANGK